MRNKITKLIILCSMLAALAAAFFLVSQVGEKTKDTMENAVVAQMEFDKIEAGMVLNEENAARTFLNQPPAVPAAGDNRQVFRIIEAIPHDACSIFPYLVEWGTREEYDKHVPIGYEGLMAVASGNYLMMFSDATTPASDSGYYTKSSEAVKRTYLDDYTVPLGAKTDFGTWYCKTQTGDSGLFMANGYFEFVGDGKGLYYLAKTYAVGYDVNNQSVDTGINHEIQPIPRKASEGAKGELYVDAPAYYWAKDHGNVNASKPKYNGGEVISQTGYNYDLSFTASSSGAYRADTNKIKKKNSGGTALDYVLVLDGNEDKINNWIGGFSFLKGGNYAVKKVESHVSGKYVRISDSKTSDHCADSSLDIGYFRLYQPVDGNCVRYNVTFEKTAWSSGYYCAEEPDSWPDTGYYFEYVDESKGIYDIPFIYTVGSQNNGALYDFALIEVTNNAGRYALTSTIKSTQNTPVYTEGAEKKYSKDYARVITYFDFTDGINWTGLDDKYNSGIGVSLGGGDSGANSERGGWVFKPVTNAAEMKVTFLSSFHKNNLNQNSNLGVEIGTKVWVTNQKLRYRYYCRDGFINNEWFKLLCYANNPNSPKDEEKPYTEIINGVGYDFSKSAVWNLNTEATKTILNGFNQNYRIEIIQKSLENLTPEDVKSADLLYLSRTEAINGITTHWDKISEQRKKYGEDPLMPLSDRAEGKFNLTASQDISAEVLFTIYDECIYNRRVALIMDHNLGIFGADIYNRNKVTRNSSKLYFMMEMFDDAKLFSSFMPTQYPDDAVDEFTRINSDGTLTICPDSQHRAGYDYLYNLEFIDDNAEDGVNAWNELHFSKVTSVSPWVVWPGTNYLGFGRDKYKEGETKLSMGDYIVSAFRNAAKENRIWKILKSRDIKDYQLAVEITNGEILAEALQESPQRWVIYADEFDPASFEIKCKVSVIGPKSTVELNNITFTFEDGTPLSNNVIQYPEWDPEEDHMKNVRQGFEQGELDEKGVRPLNPSITMKKVIVTATDMNNVVGEAEVWVVVREGFDLN